VEISFSKGSRKEFFKNNTSLILEKNEWITVEGVSGIDIGQVSLTGELVKLQMKKYGATENNVTKRILHPCTEEELVVRNVHKDREPEVLIRSRAIARTLNLDMKLCEVEIQADGKKGTFFYTADQRVDFRGLIKIFANHFKMKIEMRQIGARQESAKVGGIGSCGRELCCSTWLSDFKSVNTTAARYQNLSINQAKLSGQCGRLKCCLNYELDTYLDALSVFPDHADHLETVKGVAHLQKRDIFKNLMWYSYSDNNKQYPLSIVRVKEIQKLNKLGQKADELQPVDLEIKTDKQGNIKTEVGFVNDVGQLSLKNLEKNKKKKPGNNKGGGQRERQNPDGTPRAPQQAKAPAPPSTPRPPRPEGGQANANPNPNRNQRPKQNKRPPATPGGVAPEGESKPQPPRQNNPPREQTPRGEQPARGEQQPRQEARPPRPQQQGQGQQGQGQTQGQKSRHQQKHRGERREGGGQQDKPKPEAPGEGAA